MTSTEFNTYFEFLDQLQRSAGTIIRRHFEGEIEVERKSDETPVTRADRETEIFLRESIAKRFPEHSIFGEEYGETRRSSSWRWIIDPIDGTKSFILKTPLFGTLIALECDGVPVLGSIYFAIQDRVLIGAAETGTFLDGKRCHVSKTTDLTEATMIITDPRDLLPQPGHELVIDLAQQVRLVRGFGDCYGYYLVATGLADFMIEPKDLQYYDVAPMAPILAGAGGIFSSLEGNLDFSSGQGLAANPVLHRQIVELGRKLPSRRQD
jgi:histidinol phosphatase-like enzyme (inositol monophosphatase family)